MAEPNRGPEVDLKTAEKDPLGPNYTSAPKRAALQITIAAGIVVAMLAIFVVAFFIYVF